MSLDNNNDLQMEVVLELMRKNFAMYITIETKYTMHHLEKLMPTVRDRGRWKWIGETKVDAFNVMDKDDEAVRSHIDGHDLFPRLYFLDNSLIQEFKAWLNVRQLTITDVKVPKI